MNAEKTLCENGFKRINNGKFIRGAEAVIRKKKWWEYQINGEEIYSFTFFYDLVYQLVADNKINKVIESKKGLPLILELNGFIKNGNVYTKIAIVENVNNKYWDLTINGVKKRYFYAKQIRKVLCI